MDTSNELANAVEVIKNAIQRSQLKAVRSINQEQLTLYYGIGRYVSLNTRRKNWGKSALDTISERLNKEMPGLRGFSAPSLRKMRTFYEAWKTLSDNSFVETNKKGNDEQDSFVLTNELPPIQFTISADFPIAAFLNIGFTHHYAIISDKPMGVATYKTTADMDDKLKKLLPPTEELKKLL